MSYKAYNMTMVEALVLAAKKSPRQRRHLNLHSNYSDGIQRLLNAIGLNSYIRPHRHEIDPKHELLVALSGSLTLVLFDDVGAITSAIPFGKNQSKCENFAVEISPKTWHTLIANTVDAVVLEIKLGPFLPNVAKEYALWAPEEGSPTADEYFRQLSMRVGAAVESNFR